MAASVSHPGRAVERFATVHVTTLLSIHRADPEADPEPDQPWRYRTRDR